MAVENTGDASATPGATVPVSTAPSALGRVLRTLRARLAARDSDWAQSAYVSLLAYYTLIQHFLDPRGVVERFSLVYFALVLPVLAYVAIRWRAIVAPRDRAAHWMLAFAAAVALLAVIRWDFSNVPRAALTALVVAAVLGSRSVVSVRWLNVLFLVSIPAAIVTDLVGTNVFGLIPNQATGCSTVEPWRVSLFPLVPESAFLALFVLTLNLLFNRTASGYAMVALATYVLLFSSLRTAILALAMVLGFLLLRRAVSMRHRLVYASYFMGCAATVALTAYSSVLLGLLPKFDIGFLNIYLYRSASGVESTKELRQTVYRSAVWDYHFGVFFDRFPLGASFDVRKDTRAETRAELESVLHRPLSLDCRPQPVTGSADAPTPQTEDSVDAPTPQTEGSGATPLGAFCLGCSYFTGWIASVGIASLFLILFLASLVTRAITDQNPTLFAACLIFFPLAMFWGVLLVPYNLIFLLYLGCAYLSVDVPPARRRSRLSE